MDTTVKSYNWIVNIFSKGSGANSTIVNNRISSCCCTSFIIPRWNVSCSKAPIYFRAFVETGRPACYIHFHLHAQLTKKRISRRSAVQKVDKISPKCFIFDTVYLNIKPTDTRVPVQWGVRFVMLTGNSWLYTFTLHDRGLQWCPEGSCSGLLLCRRDTPTAPPSSLLPPPTPAPEQVLPMITRMKRPVATPALMYNRTLMCCVSSVMSSTLGTSIGGIRKPRAIPS